MVFLISPPIFFETFANLLIIIFYFNYFLRILQTIPVVVINLLQVFMVFLISEPVFLKHLPVDRFLIWTGRTTGSNTFRLANPEVGMGNKLEYNNFRYSREAGCSHYDAAGKSILGKRRIEEYLNKEDPIKHVHFLKLKKQKTSMSIKPHHGEAPNKILVKRITEKDNNVSEESNLIPKLENPIKPSAIRDFPPGCGRYASPVAPLSYKSFPQKFLTPPVSASPYYISSN